ncbi:phage tail tape measure protein [Paenibacillus chibensis]|uniref:phage tail tape measure protein n=1 Tax=Paenibacillus chibensis TaxID=59846 RepID=UPI001FEC280D|nr:phage tail tape measure protein [Paenibacillus chibensis]MEC0370051.1 phage tail tape measure protein [Paenibacillus chibensis]
MAFDLVGKIKIKDDGASKALERVKRSMDDVKKATASYSSSNDRLRTAQTRLSSQNTKNARSFDVVQKALKKTDGMFTSFAKKAAKGIAFGAMGIGAVSLGAAAYGVGASAKKAMDFEAELSTVQALTGATNSEMSKMSALALKMGADTKYNALEAAQGIEELLKAGLTPATVQAGGLEAALNLATAGELGLADAAEIMSTALNAFKKDGMAASKAADILAGTANASATGVEELRYSLAAVSAVASGMGLTFEDTNIALGLFANNGLKGSDAGTSLKTMLQNLQPTTKSQIALFSALGLVAKDGSNAFYDAKGNIKSMEDISGILHKSLSKLTNQQRALTLELMFGTDAVRAANILYTEGADGVKEFRKEMSKVTALDVARKKMDNAAGAVEQFRGAIETLQISALMPTMPLIKRFANSAADFVEKYTPRITAATDRMVKQASNYLNTHFIKNPEFQKLPDLKSKVKFVFDDVKRAFDAWWAGGGESAFQGLVTKIVGFLANALEQCIPQFVDIGLKIGKGIVNGILLGLKDLDIMTAISPVRSAEKKAKDQYDSYHSLSEAAAQNAKKNPGTPLYKGGSISAPAPSAWYENAWDGVKSGFGSVKSFVTGKGHAGGLDRVPYNSYPARLHKDEMVLTKTEASHYRDERRGGKTAPTINFNGPIHINNGMDYDTFVRKLTHDLAQ